MTTTVCNKPPVRIVQLTDTHLGSSDAFRLAGVNTWQNLGAVLSDIAVMEEKPELIIVTGDIAANEEPQSYRLLEQALQAIDVPCICLPGNHDSREALQDVLPHRRSLLLAGWQLLFLNSAVAGQVSGHLVDAELEFLAIVPVLLVMYSGCWTTRWPPRPGFCLRTSLSCYASKKVRA